MTSWSNCVASGTDWMRSLWAKRLRSCLGDLHSFLIVCELYSPMRSASSLTKSNSLAHFDRLCRFTLSRYDISPNFAQSTKPRKWSNLAFIWSLLSKIKQSACLCSDHLSDSVSTSCQAKCTTFLLKSVIETIRRQPPALESSSGVVHVCESTLFCITVKNASVPLKTHSHPLRRNWSYPAAIISLSLFPPSGFSIIKCNDACRSILVQIYGLGKRHLIIHHPLLKRPSAGLIKCMWYGHALCNSTRFSLWVNMASGSFSLILACIYWKCLKHLIGDRETVIRSHCITGNRSWGTGKSKVRLSLLLPLLLQREVVRELLGIQGKGSKYGSILLRLL